jgi:hypothetical protein
MSDVSTSTRIRALVLGLGVLLVAVVWRGFLRQNPGPEAAATTTPTAAGAPSTAAGAPSTAALPTASADASPSSRILSDAGGPVYLRINEIRLVHPGPRVRGHLRSNINAAYYDFPSDPVDGGPSWIEVGDSTHGKYFPIPRSVSYEVYFELDLPRGETVTGAAETLNLTSTAGTLSDKVPFTEEYGLFLTGHGMKASEPTAVVSYTITETP